MIDGQSSGEVWIEVLWVFYNVDNEHEWAMYTQIIYVFFIIFGINMASNVLRAIVSHCEEIIYVHVYVIHHH